MEHAEDLNKKYVINKIYLSILTLHEINKPFGSKILQKYDLYIGFEICCYNSATLKWFRAINMNIVLNSVPSNLSFCNHNSDIISFFSSVTSYVQKASHNKVI